MKRKHFYRNLPMQKKLVLSFSLPMILIFILTIFVISPILTRNYQQQVRYSVNQSCLQAEEFVWDYMNNMYYISRLMEESRELQDAFHDENLWSYQNPAQAYREFYKLNSIFRNIELSNDMYRIGIYLPDNVDYSNNHYYFYPISDLQALEKYEDIIEHAKMGHPYFQVLEEPRNTNPKKTDMYLVLFGSVKVEREGEEVSYVTKVQMLLQDIQSVLCNAKSTENNLLYLLDEQGTIIVSTEDISESVIQHLPKEMTEAWTKVVIDGEAYYVVNNEIEKYHWNLFSLIPVSDYQKLTGFVRMTLMLTTITLIISIILVSSFLSRYYVQRLSELNQKMKSIETGNINTKISVSASSEKSGDEIDEIYENFNYMADKLQQMMKAHYKLGKSVMSAELRALQAQINPHFLYNTLDLINWGAMEHGAEDVASMARNLGQFYRLSLNHGKSAILIGEELKHVDAYINIEKMHFPGAIELEIDVPDEIKQYACLNIILQPFVENAIVHGIAEHPDIIDCLITIKAVKNDKDIIFYIHDDGPGMEKEKMDMILKESSGTNGNGYGVKNINFRIKLCYGDRYGVSYDDTLEEGDGTTVILKIPAMTYEELEENLK